MIPTYDKFKKKLIPVTGTNRRRPKPDRKRCQLREGQFTRLGRGSVERKKDSKETSKLGRN